MKLKKTMKKTVLEAKGINGKETASDKANQWAALSSKNTLKTDLAQHTVAMAGLPVMTGGEWSSLQRCLARC